MRARRKSCPQTVPCSPMTARQRHQEDRCSSTHCQVMSFPTFAHAQMDSMDYVCVVYVSLMFLRFLTPFPLWACGHVDKHQWALKRRECFIANRGGQGEIK